MMKGVSMFSSAGIGELYLKKIGLNIVVANEVIERRGKLHQYTYPDAEMIIGDISKEDIFEKFIKESKKHVIDFLIASPPCQGMSIAGKNRCLNSMSLDERNYLISYVIKAIHILQPKYILIENVPSLLRLMLNYKDDLLTVPEILNKEFKDSYTIDTDILDSADYGVPQTRKRAIIRLYPKNKKWKLPKKEPKITVRDAISHLPSLESGEVSNINWHFAREHDKRHVLWMSHTKTGESAFSNLTHYPRKLNGDKIKGYDTTYRRIEWDKPAPTITIRNDAISSQRNVHPGRRLEDGTYSDARVLTPYELMILNSIPDDWDIPDSTPEILIRQCIGESIPPLMIKKIIEGVFSDD
ncbi:DNA (cytosine-5-)-methyltransferase [Pseudogracilibacillus sp. SO10305]|uniref:DNA (cytosine-5-)-methyltransferase n=1 Tax=Pseudogracilibacillus sp. SO10305 TaxID=3098292 RepID=UPI00300E5F95